MVSRRRALQLGASALVAAAGCLGGSRQSQSSPSATPIDVADAPRTTPGDVPEWSPEWTMQFDDWSVVGLDAANGLLYATLSKDEGPSAVAEIAPGEASVRWQTQSDGEAVGNSHASARGTAPWGVTLANDTVYTVSGPAEERRWSALHALDRATGERRWSIERERKLAVAGVEDGLVVATGLEFFPPPGETPVSHQTPESPLTTVVYGIDAIDGEVRWTRDFAEVRDVAVGAGGVYVAAGNRLLGLGRDGNTRFTYGRERANQVEAATDLVCYLTGGDSTATVHGVTPSGDRAWKRDVAVAELLLDGGRIYAGGDVVVGMDTDGTVVWRDTDFGNQLLLDSDGDSLYTRSGTRADAVTAYAIEGEERWTFDPPSDNAWPEAATGDALVASAITGTHADEPFLTVYAVNAEGEATASIGKDAVFDALTLDGTVYLADGASNVVALSP